MLQRRRGRDLLHEPLGAQHGGELRLEDLERDLALVLDVLGQVDGGHAARAELALDGVAVGEGVAEALVMHRMGGICGRVFGAARGGGAAGGGHAPAGGLRPAGTAGVHVGVTSEWASTHPTVPPARQRPAGASAPLPRISAPAARQRPPNSAGCAAAARFRISATSCVMALTRAW